MQALPASALLNAEQVRLPHGEHMGLVGASYVLELAPGWWVGPALYGAASGERGGLFTWGAEAQRRWRLGERWRLTAGLYAGGGGGAGAPVGGGLMLRPHADLMFDFGGWQAGLSAAHVRFPSGDIGSTQFGVQFSMDERFAFALPGQAGRSLDFGGHRGGVGADRMLPAIGRYSGRRDGGDSVGTVGLRLEWQTTPLLAGTLEAAGAASGGADGYMEVLGGVSLQWPVLGPSLQLGVRGALGLAGGGAIETGGGPIGKAALTARWQLTPAASLNLEAGRAKAFDGPFDADYAQLSFGLALGEAGSGPQWLHGMEWGAGVLHYTHAARKDGSARPMELVSLSFNRSLTQHLYLSGQAHSAMAGGAGAYSVGLVGLGATMPLAEGSAWRAGIEALVGAAGGGGVASQGGAIAQPMAWIGRDIGRQGRVRLNAGWIESRRGELSSPVVGIEGVFRFATP